MSTADVRAQIAALGGLMSTQELADRWGITRQRVGQLSSLEGFPEPAYVGPGRQRLWFRVEADDWRDVQLRGE